MPGVLARAMWIPNDVRNSAFDISETDETLPVVVVGAGR